MRARSVISRCILSVFALTAGYAYELRIAAPSAPLPVAIVTTSVPDDFPNGGVLESGTNTIAFEKQSPGSIIFVLRNLMPGEEKSFRLSTRKIPLGTKIFPEGNQLRLVDMLDHPIVAYHGKADPVPRPDIKPIYKRGGYLHPIYSPSGKVVTDDYPPNHIHHHGVWSAWTKTVFEDRKPDFWNMGEGKGTVEFVSLGEPKPWHGVVQAGFVSHHQHIDLTTGDRKPVLNESWKVTTYATYGTKLHIFDLISIQTCATASTLHLPKYHYGGLGFRGNWAWNGETKTSFLTSNGETDRIKGNETRGNWCHVGGEVDGEFTGVAILCHPDNFRAPQPMRLHPSEPFFCFAPSQLGNWSIEPGKPYISRYRFIVMDGRPNKEELDALWQDYAKPLQVTVSAR